MKKLLIRAAVTIVLLSSYFSVNQHINESVSPPISINSDDKDPGAMH